MSDSAVAVTDVRRAWIFEGLDDGELERVVAILEQRHCPPETEVVEAGSRDRRLFVVQSGSVRIVLRHADGSESPVAEVLPGQHFGEVSFIDGGVRTAAAITNEASDLLVLEPRAFERLAASEPRAALKIAWSMLRLLSSRLRGADHWLLELLGQTLHPDPGPASGA